MSQSDNPHRLLSDLSGNSVDTVDDAGTRRLAVDVKISNNGLDIKSAVLIPGNFSGNPKSATVVFTTAFDNNNYTVTAEAETNSNFSYALRIKNKLASGFDIDLGSNNIANLVGVSWQAIQNGES